jgi:hypothetical protein
MKREEIKEDVMLYVGMFAVLTALWWAWKPLGLFAAGLIVLFSGLESYADRLKRKDKDDQ